MKLSQIEKRIPQTLTNWKDVIQKENTLADVAGPDQRAAKKKEAWGPLLESPSNFSGSKSNIKMEI